MPAVSIVESDSVRYLRERAEPADLIDCDSLDADRLLGQGWRVLWSGYQAILARV